LAHSLNYNVADQDENRATATKGRDRPDLLRKGQNRANGHQPNPEYHKAKPRCERGRPRKLPANLRSERGDQTAPNHFQ
jgi:hypothetical protein